MVNHLDVHIFIYAGIRKEDPGTQQPKTIILSWNMTAWQLPSRDNMQDGCPWWIHPGSAKQSNFWVLANKKCEHFPSEKQWQELWLLRGLYASAECKINRMILIWHEYLHKFSGVEFWIANCCTQCATIYDGIPYGDHCHVLWFFFFLQCLKVSFCLCSKIYGYFLSSHTQLPLVNFQWSNVSLIVFVRFPHFNQSIEKLYIIQLALFWNNFMMKSSGCVFDFPLPSNIFVLFWICLTISWTKFNVKY